MSRTPIAVPALSGLCLLLACSDNPLDVEKRRCIGDYCPSVAPELRVNFSSGDNVYRSWMRIAVLINGRAMDLGGVQGRGMDNEYTLRVGDTVDVRLAMVTHSGDTVAAQGWSGRLGAYMSYWVGFTAGAPWNYPPPIGVVDRAVPIVGDTVPPADVLVMSTSSYNRAEGGIR